MGGEPPGDLVGRDRELSTIETFLETVPTGFGALLIEGDLGVGKSVLWEASVAAATTRGFRVLSARPSEAEADLAFSSLVDLLGDGPPSQLSDLPAPQREALEAALFLADPEAPPSQLAVSLAVLGVLRTLAQDVPVVVALDDAQWVDRPSALALEYAVRRLRSVTSGVVAVAPGRSEDLPLRIDRAVPASRLTRLHVGPLPAKNLTALLRNQLQIRVSRSHVEEIHRVTGGNPLFAIEVARASAGMAPAPVEPVPVPRDLRDLIRSRSPRGLCCSSSQHSPHRPPIS
jgi:predicted ATPase